LTVISLGKPCHNDRILREPDLGTREGDTEGNMEYETHVEAD